MPKRTARPPPQVEATPTSGGADPHRGRVRPHSGSTARAAPMVATGRRVSVIADKPEPHPVDLIPNHALPAPRYAICAGGFAVEVDDAFDDTVLHRPLHWAREPPERSPTRRPRAPPRFRRVARGRTRPLRSRTTTEWCRRHPNPHNRVRNRVRSPAATGPADHRTRWSPCSASRPKRPDGARRPPIPVEPLSGESIEALGWSPCSPSRSKRPGGARVRRVDPSGRTLGFSSPPRSPPARSSGTPGSRPPTPCSAGPRPPPCP